MRLTSLTNQRSSSHSAIPSPVCARGTSTSSAEGSLAAEASLASHLLLPRTAAAWNSRAGEAAAAAKRGGERGRRRRRSGGEAAAGPAGGRGRGAAGRRTAGMTGQRREREARRLQAMWWWEGGLRDS